MKINGKT